MKTKDQEIIDAAAAHEKKLAEIEMRHAILDLVPEPLRRFDIGIHVYRLWDRVASIKFKASRFRISTDTAIPMALEHVREVVTALPDNVPLALYRDGCASFRSLESALAEKERADARMADGHDSRANVTPVAPFTLELDYASHTQRETVAWLTRTPLGIIEIGCELPILSLRDVVTVSITRSGDSSFGRTPTISSVNATINLKASVLGSTKASYLKRPMNDDRSEPNRIEVYWDAYGDTDTTTRLPHPARRHRRLSQPPPPTWSITMTNGLDRLVTVTITNPATRIYSRYRIPERSANILITDLSSALSPFDTPVTIKVSDTSEYTIHRRDTADDTLDTEHQMRRAFLLGDLFVTAATLRAAGLDDHALASQVRPGDIVTDDDGGAFYNHPTRGWVRFV